MDPNEPHEARDYDLREVREIAAQGRRLAIYDRATGLYAYWYLQLRVGQELSRVHRHGRAIFIASVWAPTPDPAAVLVGRFKTGLREHDMAAYLNNGHFVAMLTETDERGAVRVLGRLLEGLEGGVSCGLSRYPHDGATFDELLEVAKSRGRRPAKAA